MQRKTPFGSLEEDFNAFADRVDAGAPITLDQWIHDGQGEWPEHSEGFRVGRRGQLVWSAALYPDGCSGHLVQVSRIVHEYGETFNRVVYLDRDTVMRFVFKRCARCEGDERPVLPGDGAPWAGRLICSACTKAITKERAPE